MEQITSKCSQKRERVQRWIYIVFLPVGRFVDFFSRFDFVTKTKKTKMEKKKKKTFHSGTIPPTQSTTVASWCFEPSQPERFKSVLKRNINLSPKYPTQKSQNNTLTNKKLLNNSVKIFYAKVTTKYFTRRLLQNILHKGYYHSYLIEYSRVPQDAVATLLTDL